MAEKKLKLVSNAPLYKDVRTLLGLIVETAPDFPRMYRYTIGGEMQKLSVSLLNGVAAAYMDKPNRRDHLDKPNRRDHLTKVRYEFETLKTLVRIAGEKRWIKGLGRHAQLIELMDAIGKQITAWKNSLPVGSE